MNPRSADQDVTTRNCSVITASQAVTSISMRALICAIIMHTCFMNWRRLECLTRAWLVAIAAPLPCYSGEDKASLRDSVSSLCLSYMKASGGGGCRLPPPRESSAMVSAMYATPRISDMAPVTMAVPWPGLRPALFAASPSGDGGVGATGSLVLVLGFSGSSAKSETERLDLQIRWCHDCLHQDNVQDLAQHGVPHK